MVLKTIQRWLAVWRSCRHQVSPKSLLSGPRVGQLQSLGARWHDLYAVHFKAKDHAGLRRREVKLAFDIGGIQVALNLVKVETRVGLGWVEGGLRVG